MLAAGFKDLGFNGNRYTWANNRKGHYYVAARLDRALANSAWMDHFEDPPVTNLPRISSDNSPLLLSHRSSLPLKNAPFKFEEMWLYHDSFIPLVKDSWAIPCRGSPQFPLAEKLKFLKSKLKSWNYEVFGQLKHNIAKAKRKVVEAQSLYDSNPSESLQLDLTTRKSNMHNWLNVESVHWKQKSKIRWLKDGDRNTKFIHMSAKSRNSVNRIDRISIDGIIIDDAKQIRNEACSFFSNLLQSSFIVPDEALFNRPGPVVSAE